MKKEILQLCRQMVATKVAAIDREMADLQESANSDTKSAMGDKYETGRAMIQLEQENLYERKSQLMEQSQMLSKLSSAICHEAIPGALVTTDMGVFYISAGLGKLDVEGRQVFAVSPDSPIARQMFGKKAGDPFEINGKVVAITTIS